MQASRSSRRMRSGRRSCLCFLIVYAESEFGVFTHFYIPTKVPSNPNLWLCSRHRVVCGLYLKCQLQSQLYDARIARGSNRAEGGALVQTVRSGNKGAIDQSEIRMVENVEHLRAKLQ